MEADINISVTEDLRLPSPLVPYTSPIVASTVDVIDDVTRSDGKNCGDIPFSGISRGIPNSEHVFSAGFVDVYSPGDASMSSELVESIGSPQPNSHNTCTDSEDEDEKEPLSPELLQGLRILTEISSDANKALNWPFMNPVDPDAEGCADYFQKVDKPMWLNKMKEKFRRRQYTTITEFMSDMRLMLENCYRFNGPDHPISKKAQKLETVLEQKLALLSRELREKTSIAATSGRRTTSSVTGTRRRKAIVPHDSTALLNQLRLEEKEKEKEHRRQLMEERKKVQEDFVAGLQSWEDKLLEGKLRDQLNAMWELPQIGHFLMLCSKQLNIGEVAQYELERCFLMPRESSTLQRIMTTLTSTPYQRSCLDRKPHMPYKVWGEKLKVKVRHWYKIFKDSQKDAHKAALRLGLEDTFFKVVGRKNPLEKKPFHELSFYQRVWLMKGLCDFILEQQDDLREAIDIQPVEEQREYILGTDAEGNSYLHFPQFCGADLRIYRQAPIVLPSLEKKETIKNKEEYLDLVHGRKKKGRVKASRGGKTRSASAVPESQEQSRYRDSRLRQHPKQRDITNSNLSGTESVHTLASQDESEGHLTDCESLTNESTTQEPPQKTPRLKRSSPWKSDTPQLQNLVGDDIECSKENTPSFVRRSLRKVLEESKKLSGCSKYDSTSRSASPVVLLESRRRKRVREMSPSSCASSPSVQSREPSPTPSSHKISPRGTPKSKRKQPVRGKAHSGDDIVSQDENAESDIAQEQTSATFSTAVKPNTDAVSSRLSCSPFCNDDSADQGFRKESETEVPQQLGNIQLPSQRASTDDFNVVKTETNSEKMSEDQMLVDSVTSASCPSPIRDSKSQCLDSNALCSDPASQDDCCDYSPCVKNDSFNLKDSVAVSESEDCSNGFENSFNQKDSPLVKSEIDTMTEMEGKLGLKNEVEEDGSSLPVSLDSMPGSRTPEMKICKSESECDDQTKGVAHGWKAATADDDHEDDDDDDGEGKVVMMSNNNETSTCQAGMLSMTNYDEHFHDEEKLHTSAGEDMNGLLESSVIKAEQTEGDCANQSSYNQGSLEDSGAMECGESAISNKEADSSDEEDLPEIEPNLESFRLVVDSVESLRQLVALFEETSDSSLCRSKSGRYGPRKKCVVELHERLVFLLKELEPWESKLISAQKKACIKMRKEQENYVEVEEKQPVKDVWNSEEGSSDSDSDSDSTVDNAVCSVQDDAKPKVNKIKKVVPEQASTSQEEDITEIDLSVSSRGRLRKRRIIPNNTEDQSFKKKKKASSEENSRSSTPNILQKSKPPTSSFTSPSKSAPPTSVTLTQLKQFAESQPPGMYSVGMVGNQPVLIKGPPPSPHVKQPVQTSVPTQTITTQESITSASGSKTIQALLAAARQTAKQTVSKPQPKPVTGGSLIRLTSPNQLAPAASSLLQLAGQVATTIAVSEPTILPASQSPLKVPNPASTPANAPVAAAAATNPKPGMRFYSINTVGQLEPGVIQQLLKQQDAKVKKVQPAVGQGIVQTSQPASIQPSANAGNNMSGETTPVPTNHQLFTNQQTPQTHPPTISMATSSVTLASVVLPLSTQGNTTAVVTQTVTNISELLEKGSLSHRQFKLLGSPQKSKYAGNVTVKKLLEQVQSSKGSPGDMVGKTLPSTSSVFQSTQDAKNIVQSSLAEASNIQQAKIASSSVSMQQASSLTDLVSAKQQTDPFPGVQKIVVVSHAAQNQSEPAGLVHKAVAATGALEGQVTESSQLPASRAVAMLGTQLPHAAPLQIRLAQPKGQQGVLTSLPQGISIQLIPAVTSPSDKKISTKGQTEVSGFQQLFQDEIRKQKNMSSVKETKESVVTSSHSVSLPGGPALAPVRIMSSSHQMPQLQAINKGSVSAPQPSHGSQIIPLDKHSSALNIVQRESSNPIHDVHGKTDSLTKRQPVQTHNQYKAIQQPQQNIVKDENTIQMQQPGTKLLSAIPKVLVNQPSAPPVSKETSDTAKAVLMQQGMIQGNPGQLVQIQLASPQDLQRKLFNQPQVVQSIKNQQNTLLSASNTPSQVQIAQQIQPNVQQLQTVLVPQQEGGSLNKGQVGVTIAGQISKLQQAQIVTNITTASQSVASATLSTSSTSWPSALQHALTSNSSTSSAQNVPISVTKDIQVLQSGVLQNIKIAGSFPTSQPNVKKITIDQLKVAIAKKQAIDKAIKTVITTVNTSLPTAQIKVVGSSPLQMPSRQPHRPVTMTTTSMKGPIPVVPNIVSKESSSNEPSTISSPGPSSLPVTHTLTPAQIRPNLQTLNSSSITASSQVRPNKTLALKLTPQNIMTANGPVPGIVLPPGVILPRPALQQMTTPKSEGGQGLLVVQQDKDGKISQVHLEPEASKPDGSIAVTSSVVSRASNVTPLAMPIPKANQNTPFTTTDNVSCGDVSNLMSSAISASQTPIASQQLVLSKPVPAAVSSASHPGMVQLSVRPQVLMQNSLPLVRASAQTVQQSPRLLLLNVNGQLVSGQGVNLNSAVNANGQKVMLVPGNAPQGVVAGVQANASAVQVLQPSTVQPQSQSIVNVQMKPAAPMSSPTVALPSPANVSTLIKDVPSLRLSTSGIHQLAGLAAAQQKLPIIVSTTS